MVATLDDAQDFYGTDVLLSASGDLTVNAAGQLLLLSGPLNCGQAAIARMRTAVGELPLHPEYGSTLDAKAIGGRAGDPQLLVSIVNAELRGLFEADARFLRAHSINAKTDRADPTRAAIDLKLDLAGGDTLAVQNVTDPAAASFEVQPAAIAALGDSEIPDFLGTDDDDSDEIPDLDDVLEGDN